MVLTGWESHMSAVDQFLAIRRVVSVWESRANAELGASHGISLSDFAVLHQLEEAKGRLRRVDLARRLALTPSGVTRLLAPLERRGIVSRVVDGRDARATHAVISQSGKDLLKEATQTVARLARSIFAGMGERDLAVFQKLTAP